MKRLTLYVVGALLLLPFFANAEKSVRFEPAVKTHLRKPARINYEKWAARVVAERGIEFVFDKRSHIVTKAYRHLANKNSPHASPLRSAIETLVKTCTEGGMTRLFGKISEDGPSAKVAALKVAQHFSVGETFSDIVPPHAFQATVSALKQRGWAPTEADRSDVLGITVSGAFNLKSPHDTDAIQAELQKRQPIPQRFLHFLREK